MLCYLNWCEVSSTDGVYDDYDDDDDDDDDDSSAYDDAVLILLKLFLSFPNSRFPNVTLLLIIS